MDDSETKRYLNALAVRCLVQECQILALRRILSKTGLVDDDKLEKMIASCVDAKAELLAADKSDEERFALILRSFEGPIQ
jgi:hypothetical protein